MHKTPYSSCNFCCAICCIIDLLLWLNYTHIQTLQKDNISSKENKVSLAFKVRLPNTLPCHYCIKVY